MSMDITHCTGEGCIISKDCHRYRPGVKEFTMNTSYFIKPPFTIEHKLFKCNMFWGDKSKHLLAMFKSISK